MMLRLVLLLVCGGNAAGQSRPDTLTVTRDGTLPIVLSAPHGGRKPIPGALLRRGIGVDQFVTVTDDNTDLLTEAIARHLETKLKGKPFVVIAQFQRKYADANRPAPDAYESDAAKPIYEHYHKALAKARETISREWGVGLVIDIHGQGVEPNTIFRGTANGKSVKHLLDRHGEAALSGPESLFGHLARNDVKVHPVPGTRDKENPRFNGGYIVQAYGSADGGRIDAIQMEFGTNLRQKAQLDKTAQATADAIAAFAREFLPASRQTAR